MRCITYKHKTKKTQVDKWVKVTEFRFIQLVIQVKRENVYENIMPEKDPNLKAKQKYLDQLADLAMQYAKAIDVLKEKEI